MGGRFIGKLGRKAPRRDARTLQLANYVDHGVLPHVPPKFDWNRAVKTWPVMLNDRLGDCTCACTGHVIQCWTANAGQEVILPDDDILRLYEAVSGYDPATGTNDDGAVELDVLNYWRQNGVAGHKIGAYVALEPMNHDHLRIATFLFGAVYTGIALPETIQMQDVWAVPPEGPNGAGAPGSLGGHAVPITGYDALGVTCVTWGRLQRMTWGFVDEYMEEAYCLLSAADWFGGGKVAPSGFDIAALQDDLVALQSPTPPHPWPVAQP
jgi:hypothetical protein